MAVSLLRAISKISKRKRIHFLPLHPHDRLNIEQPLQHNQISIKMQDPSYVFCKQLRSFCEHLQTMCSSLKSSMNQRPIPIDSSLNPFVEEFSSRAISMVKEVEALESMTIDTISFRELLGYCNELYKQNENACDIIEDRLKEYGYEPAHIDKSEEPFPFEGSSSREDKVAVLETLSNRTLASQTPTQTTNYKTSRSAGSILNFTAASATGCSKNTFEDDPLFGDSISLQDFGFSDACLATLAREANTENCSPVCDPPIQGQRIKRQDKETPTYHWNDQDVSSNAHDTIDSYQSKYHWNDQHVLSNAHHPIDSNQSTYHWNDGDVLFDAHHPIDGYHITKENKGNTENFKEECIADHLLEVSKEEYDKTPSWLRGLASWEELDDAIHKINNLLSSRAKQGYQSGAEWLDQDDLEPLGFGPKAKPFLLLLVRMNCLTIEQQGDETIYRVNLK